MELYTLIVVCGHFGVWHSLTTMCHGWCVLSHVSVCMFHYSEGGKSTKAVPRHADCTWLPTTDDGVLFAEYEVPSASTSHFETEDYSTRSPLKLPPLRLQPSNSDKQQGFSSPTRQFEFLPFNSGSSTASTPKSVSVASTPRSKYSATSQSSHSLEHIASSLKRRTGHDMSSGSILGHLNSPKE